MSILLSLEVIEIRYINQIGKEHDDVFLPMVYENQIYQSSSTDGCEIYSPVFHQSYESHLPILVFRYSGLSCKSCVQSCINGLRKQCPDFENNKRVLFVVSDVSKYDEHGQALVLKHNETLGYDLEETRIPHFFVYDPSTQKIMHTFVPDQSDLNALQIYLSTVLGRYRI